MAKTCCVWLLTVGGTLAWGVDAETQLNVQGQALEKCDRSHVDDPRYPTTGYMRPVEELANRCTAVSHDAGRSSDVETIDSMSTPDGCVFPNF
mmetsp:Transcript_21097/g.39595  ORF Transcript_21097/g.39595 Transcript_21097/m.39595 type:complete len:93 (+) Transcript_21097:3-281(+)